MFIKVASFIGVLICLSIPAFADDLSQAKFDSLIKQLSSDDFSEREGASQELARRGKTIARDLLLARAKTTDPEVKARINGIIARVHTHVIGPIEVANAVASEMVKIPIVKEMCRSIQNIVVPTERAKSKELETIIEELRTDIKKLPHAAIPTRPLEDEEKKAEHEKMLQAWEGFAKRWVDGVEKRASYFEPYIESEAFKITNVESSVPFKPRERFKQQDIIEGVLSFVVFAFELRITSRSYTLERDGETYLLDIPYRDVTMTALKPGAIRDYDSETKESLTRTFKVSPAEHFASIDTLEFLLAGTDKSVTKEDLKKTLKPMEVTISATWENGKCVLSPAEPGKRSTKMGDSMVKDFYEKLLDIHWTEASEIIALHEPFISGAFEMGPERFAPLSRP
jgi:hypothetical protein